ncbi:MAG: phytoene desaturase family protein [Terriglobales bacterium]
MGEADAIVIGAGPNGLAAAIVLARAGVSVLLLEAEETLGGSCRSAELTLPGFVHDTCSAIHPFAYASPFFRTLPLEQFGLAWIHPDVAVAQTLENAPPSLLERAVSKTGATLGSDDDAYVRFMQPVVDAYRKLDESPAGLLQLLRHPFHAARLGLRALQSAETVARDTFGGEAALALLAGNAAHSMLSLRKLGTAGIALALLAVGHAHGWPFPRGGAQQFSDALAAYFRSLGGQIQTGFRVESPNQLPPARAILCDLTPRQLLRIAGDRLPAPYRRVLEHYRYGLAAFKMDWALDGPVPWKHPEIARAGTVHVAGGFEEIVASERQAWRGNPSERPFVIAGQHTLFDTTRAPEGKHTLWAYCHVPNGSEVDMSGRMEAQIERFAPGFRERILARHTMGPRALEAHNANLVGGDILGGLQDLWQTFARPSLRYYATPLKNLFLCSSSTPPGAGVHGMCGYFAAEMVLRRVFRK